MNKRRLLTGLLVISFILSACWAFVIPTDRRSFQPDEYSHIAVVQFMATHHGAIPPYRMGYDTSVHPPLYHALAALIYSIVYPLGGVASAIFIIRLCSAMIGTGTIYAIYRMARQLPFCRNSALPAAMLVALIPMRVALSGAITNENLAALAAAASLNALYSAIRLGFTNRRLFWLCFWTVVAIGSKITCLGLVPAIAIGVIAARKPGQPLMRSIWYSLAPVVAVLLALGWWFVYNTIVYGDPLRKQAADRLWDGVQPGYAGIALKTGMAPWRYLLSILGGGWFSFWGQFDAMRYRFPLGVYGGLLILHLVAFWGIITRGKSLLCASRSQIAIGAATTVFVAWVLLIYIQYNWLHYTPQGRYFYVLLGPLLVGISGGMSLFLSHYLPDTRSQRYVWFAVAALLLVLNIYALLVMPSLRSVG